jgi:signal peptidase II
MHQTERRHGVSWGTALTIAAVVLVFDQATKAWVLQNLPGAPPLTVIPGFFNLTFSRNTGGVFGLLAGAPSFARRALFVGVTAIALGVIVVFLRRWGRESRLLTVALSLVAGGAVGNLLDRLRFGSVVDFIDWYWGSHHWYTFNVADSAISTGAVLLVVHSLLPEASAAGTRPDPLPPGPEA